MDNSKMLARLTNLEAVAGLVIDECRKVKKELEAADRPKPKRRQLFTEEDAAQIHLQRRVAMFGKRKN